MCAWIPGLAMPPAKSITLGKLLNLSVAKFLICKIDVLIIPTLQGGCGDYTSNHVDHLEQ